MAVTINGKEKRIGLALSGGGYRAAGFHLGVLYKLRELSLLDKIDVFSCVSGGSILGGYYTYHINNPDVLKNFEKFLLTNTIDVTSVISGIINIFSSRIERLEKCYKELLFSNKDIKLSDLNKGPRIYFNATNLSTGNAFIFVTGENKNDTGIGDWELGFHQAPDFPVSKAIAASSAFPPVYQPVILKSKVYPAKNKVDYVSLTDGGVYDNMGINPLLNLKYNNLDYIIMSDGGKPFSIDEDATKSGLLTVVKSLDITMEQVRGLSFYKLVDSFKINSRPKPLWFSIDSTDGEQIKGDAHKASSISTRLKKLSKEEMEVLKRHGGALVFHRIKRWANELLL